MIPPIIHQVHFGPPPSEQVREWMLGLQLDNRDFKYMLWNEDNVHELGLETWQWEHSTLAGSSNIIRLHALNKHGGIYVDTDCESVKSLMSLINCEAFFARQPDGVPCNAVMAAHPEHDWIQSMIGLYGDQRVKDAAWGCHVMEPAGIKYHRVTELPTETFYPFGHGCPGGDRFAFPNSYLIHQWLGSWIQKP